MKELKTFTTGKGTYDSFPDKTARAELPKKLTRPATAQVGDYLRIKAIGADGTMEVEAVPAPTGGATVPTKVSAFENDAGYVDEQRVQELLSEFPSFEITVVQELPAVGKEKTIYLVPFASEDGQYLEYLYVNGSWEVVGSGNDSGGNPGQDGATFTPAVSEDGTLSWTNDKGLDNPEPVNIMGPVGPQGAPGDDYVLTDDDVQEIAEIAAGLVEVPDSGGGTKRWVKRAVATVTEEETTRIKFDVDLDGNPLNIKKTNRWVVESSNVDYSTDSYVDLQVNRNWNGGTTHSVACRVNTRTDASHLSFSVEQFATGALMIQGLCAEPSTQTQRTSFRIVTTGNSYDGENISIISLLCKSGTYFAVGSTFTVWEEVFE